MNATEEKGLPFIRPYLLLLRVRVVSLSPEWKAKEKHVFLFTNSARPIYTRSPLPLRISVLLVLFSSPVLSLNSKMGRREHVGIAHGGICWPDIFCWRPGRRYPLDSHLNTQDCLLSGRSLLQGEISLSDLRSHLCCDGCVHRRSWISNAFAAEIYSFSGSYLLFARFLCSFKVISLLTNTAVKVLETNARFDLRNLLDGLAFRDWDLSFTSQEPTSIWTALQMMSLYRTSTFSTPSILFVSLPTFEIRLGESWKPKLPELAIYCSFLFLSCLLPTLLSYSLLLARGHIVSLVRPKNHILYPPDLLLLLNFVNSTVMIRENDATFTPICLPQFNRFLQQTSIPVDSLVVASCIFIPVLFLILFASSR